MNVVQKEGRCDMWRRGDVMWGGGEMWCGEEGRCGVGRRGDVMWEGDMWCRGAERRKGGGGGGNESTAQGPLARL